MRHNYNEKENTNYNPLMNAENFILLLITFSISFIYYVPLLPEIKLEQRFLSKEWLFSRNISPYKYFYVLILISIIFISCILFAMMTFKEFKEKILLNSYLSNGNHIHRLSIEEVFKNENRKKIIKEILKNPGIHYNKLLRNCKLQSGQLQWHLKILLGYRAIFKKRIGQYLVFYAAFAKKEIDDVKLELKKSKTTCKVLKIIEDNPGIITSEIANRLDMERNSIKYHTDKLLEKSFISSIKTGRQIQLFSN
ncbi:MAG: winged helix-turn-helix transcriptional regulator [Promethearchaeota archaeon]